MTEEKRNADGTFKAGHDYATGRPKGSRNKTLMILENAGEDAAVDLVNTVIQAGRAGDVAAAKLILERIWPVRKARFPIALPEIKTTNDLWQAMVDTYNSASQGDMAVEEAKETLDMISTMAKNLALSFKRA